MYFLSSLDPAVSSGGMGPAGLVPHDQNIPFPSFSHQLAGVPVEGQSGIAAATIHAPVRPISPVAVFGGPQLPPPVPTPVTLPGTRETPMPQLPPHDTNYGRIGGNGVLRETPMPQVYSPDPNFGRIGSSNAVRAVGSHGTFTYGGPIGLRPTGGPQRNHISPLV